MHIRQLFTLLAYGLFSSVSSKSQVFKEDFLDHPAISQPPPYLLSYFISILPYLLSASPTSYKIYDIYNHLSMLYITASPLPRNNPWHKTDDLKWCVQWINKCLIFCAFERYEIERILEHERSLVRCRKYVILSYCLDIFFSFIKVLLPKRIHLRLLWLRCRLSRHCTHPLYKIMKA